MGQPDTVRQLLKRHATLKGPEIAEFFDRNVTYQFGNAPAAVGIDPIRHATVSRYSCQHGSINR